MGKIDRYIVPGTVVVAMLAMFFVTNAWIKRPADVLQWRVTIGPPNITTPGHEYGLRFTPRNILSGHAIKGLTQVSSSRDCKPRLQCVDVTVTNTALTYVSRLVAYRRSDGSYEVPFTFPHADDYVIFVEMRPRVGDYQAKRLPDIGALRLGRCGANVTSGGRCQAARARLRGQEAVRSQNVDGLTVVLGTPVRAIESGSPGRVGLIFLQGDRTARDVAPLTGTDGDAVAISMDTYHFVRLHVDRNRDANGVVTYTGTFDVPGIYRVWAPASYHRRRIQTSFVVDVNPAPTPTPAGQ